MCHFEEAFCDHPILNYRTIPTSNFLHGSQDLYFVLPGPQAHGPWLPALFSVLQLPSPLDLTGFCSLNKLHISSFCSCCACSLECLPPIPPAPMPYLIFKVQFKYLLLHGAFLIFPGTLGPHSVCYNGSSLLLPPSVL